MAGAGHKLWAAGDVVGATGGTSINTYLQDQIVGVYADSSARDAAFGGAGEPTLAEGMVCYLNDTNELQVYNGSAWVAVLDVDTISVSSGAYTLTNALSISGDHDFTIGTVNTQILAAAAGSASAGNVSYSFYGDTDCGMFRYNTNSIALATAGVGRLTIVADGTVNCVGEFTAGTKTFDIVHPIKGGDWRLRHASIEGPRNDLIYRGTVTLSGGTATVDLDEASNMTDGTWEALCRDPWSMVASSGHAVEWSLSGKTLTITSDTADAVCSWIVMAERQDEHLSSPEAPSCDSDGNFLTEYEQESPELDLAGRAAAGDADALAELAGLEA